MATMAKVEIPFVDQRLDENEEQMMLNIIESERTVRLSKLAEMTGYDRDDLHLSLMQFVEQGDVAVFPVGDSVQVRFDS